MVMKMIESQHLIIVFNSLHRVMLAELRLKPHFSLLLMPVPRAISADCGMVLRIERKDGEAVVEMLQQEGLQPFELYAPAHDGFELVGEFS